MAVPVRAEWDLRVVEVDAVEAVEPDRPVEVVHDGVGLLEALEADAGGEEVLGVEADPEAAVVPAGLDELGQLFEAPPYRAARSGRVLEQESAARGSKGRLRLVEGAAQLGGDRREHAMEACAAVAPDVEDEAAGAHPGGHLEVRDETAARPLEQLLLAGGEVYEVAGVADGRLQLPVGGHRGRIFGQDLAGVAGRPPGPGALGVDLEKVGPDRLCPPERREQAPGGRDVGAEEHGATVQETRLARGGQLAAYPRSVASEAAERKYLVRTFGCQMNEHDSERISAILRARGLERTEDAEEADVVVLNTCCIRQNADDKLYGHLGHLKSLQERRPGMQIAVGGCLAQKDRERLLQRAPFVDAVFGTFNVGRVAELLEEARQAGSGVIEILDAPPDDETDFPAALPVREDLPHAAWVTIQVGCDNSCAFCIVPSVRGGEVSRPFSELLGEVERLAHDGVVEVTLLGQNVNSYGRDLALRWRGAAHPSHEVEAAAGALFAAEPARRARPLFADLLRAVGSVPGIRRVRFTSPHPKDLRPETIAAMAETEAVCEQLHLPLQSGSDRVLAAMRRGYTAERYLERLAAARSAIDDLAVTTDLIVGFPGETDEDFRQTLEVVAEAGYDSAFTFIFSPRPGTRAAAMEDDFIAAEVIAERFEALKAVLERSCLARNSARVGRVEEALVEGASKRNPALLTGRTRQGKLVHFAPEGEVPVGSFVAVRIDQAAPHHLSGTQLLVEPPGLRRRTPLRLAAGA